MIFLRLKPIASPVNGVELVTTLNPDHKVETDSPKSQLHKVPVDLLVPLLVALGKEGDSCVREICLCANFGPACQMLAGLGAAAKRSIDDFGVDLIAEEIAGQLHEHFHDYQRADIVALLRHAFDVGGVHWSGVVSLVEQDAYRDKVSVGAG